MLEAHRMTTDRSPRRSHRGGCIRSRSARCRAASISARTCFRPAAAARRRRTSSITRWLPAISSRDRAGTRTRCGSSSTRARICRATRIRTRVRSRCIRTAGSRSPRTSGRTAASSKAPKCTTCCASSRTATWSRRSPGTVSTMAVTPGGGGTVHAVGDLTPAYDGDSAVQSWTRTIDFTGATLAVHDSYATGREHRSDLPDRRAGAADDQREHRDRRRAFDHGRIAGERDAAGSRLDDGRR